MAEYIERDAAVKSFNGDNQNKYYHFEVVNRLRLIPAANVREVILCGECYLHTHCRTEDVFDFAGLQEENRFCSVGKRKTNGAQMGGAEDDMA